MIDTLRAYLGVGVSYALAPWRRYEALRDAEEAEEMQEYWTGQGCTRTAEVFGHRAEVARARYETLEARRQGRHRPTGD